MNRLDRLVAVAIPLSCIAFFLLYFHQTRDHFEFVSVQFPYTIGLIGLLLFSIVAVQEIRKARRSPSGDREEDEPAPALLRLPPFTDRRWNPFFLVVLTLLFTVSLPHIKSVLAVYLYVCLLRLVFRKATLRTCVLDLVLVVLLYVVFNDLLRILLPAGPVEEAISAVVRSVIRG